MGYQLKVGQFSLNAHFRQDSPKHRQGAKG